MVVMVMMILHGHDDDHDDPTWWGSWSCEEGLAEKQSVANLVSPTENHFLYFSFSGFGKKVISKSMMLLLTRLFLFLSLFSWKNRSSSLKIVVTQDIHLSLKPCNWLKLTILATLFLHLAEQRGVSTSYIEWKAEKLTWKNLGFDVPWMEFTWYLFWSFL